MQGSLSLPTPSSLRQLTWLSVLLAAAACDCGVKTTSTSNGITLVIPAGPASQVERTIDFGAVRVSVVKSQPIQLRNDSRASWTITSMALTPDSSHNLFLKLPAGGLPTLGPGQTYEGELRYQPSKVGDDTGTVNITTNSTQTPKYIIHVKGSGGASKIDVCTTDDSGQEACAQEAPDGKLVIDMGKVAPPGSTMKPLTVKSLGNLPLNLTSVAPTPTTSPDFSVKTGPLPTQIPEQKTVEYTATFQPTVGGEEDGAIEFDSDDPVTPRLLVYLKAVGDAPRLCIDPTTVEFGDVSLGSTAMQTLKLTSCGTKAITLQNLTITDAGSGAGSPPPPPLLFQIAMAPSLPLALDAGQSLDVNLTFQPMNFGDANGKLLVATEDGERGIVPMHGRGVGCSLLAQPAAVNFSSVPAGGHQSSTVVISNTGTGTCNISSFDIQSGAGSTFSVTNPPMTPVMLNPGETQAVVVTYSPTAAGNSSDNLVVSANTASPLLVPLKGSAITPPPCVLVPQPSAVMFSDTSAGQTSNQNVVVTNEGTQSCWITAVNIAAVNGGSTAAFTAKLTNPPAPNVPGGFGTVEIPAGKTGTITVTFAPTSAQTQSADLVIDYDQQDMPEFPPIILSPYHLHIPLTGGELPPKICVNPASLDFGSVPGGSSKTMPFTITSCGAGTLWLRGLKMEAGSSRHFSILPGVRVPQFLPAGQSVTVNVQYAPANTLGDFGDVAIMSNDPNTPKALVPVRGNVTNVCDKQLSCGVTELDFPTMEVGRTAALTLTCINVGDQPVTVTGATVSSASNAYNAAAVATQTVAPGDSIRVEVDYTPQQAGNDTGTITINSDACAAVTVKLVGAGKVPNYPPCPPQQVFSPQVKWNWNGTGSGVTQPSSNNVAMSPIVVNLDDDNGDGRVDADDIPEVLFTTCSSSQCCINCLNPSDFSTSDFSGIGMLRALHGKDGSSYFDITDTGLQLAAVTQLATADLDGDNLPEIIAVQHSFHQGSGMQGMQGKYISGSLLVFDHTGKLEFMTDQWTGDPNSFEFGSAPAIADLDGDGKPEIVFERTVFHYDGTKWYDMSASGNWGHGAFPTIADVNGDGKPEIVSGSYVYSGDGTLLWTGPGSGSACDPTSITSCAVGGGMCDPLSKKCIMASGPTMVLGIHNTTDPSSPLKPVVVLRDGSQSVHILDGATGKDMASATWQPPGTNSNDPTQSSNGICPAASSAADLDGDGNPELIIPAGDYLYVWKYTYSSSLQLLWKAPIQDYEGQCGASGSAAFDFEGQGHYDVVYHDTQYMYVFRGIDGSLIYQAPRNSSTIFETPVIADVDNDGHADLVMTNESGFLGGTLAGVEVLSNSGNTWPETRRVWSDHAYHESEITEDATVPRVENYSWKTNNSWRSQEPLCTP